MGTQQPGVLKALEDDVTSRKDNYEGNNNSEKNDDTEEENKSKTETPSVKFIFS